MILKVQGKARIENFVNIVHVFDLFIRPGLVLEEAPLAVGAEESLVERGARLRLVLVVVDRRRLAHQLVIAVRELALRAVTAQAHFNPILAHLRLVLSLVHFQLLLLLLLLLGGREERLSIKLKLDTFLLGFKFCGV